jgi:DNA-binding transcriptional LysR family regulator
MLKAPKGSKFVSKRSSASIQRHLVATRLRYFDVVRRCKSIREASRQLNVASSAVSRQLISLEQLIGAPLFDRLASGLKLTAAGEALARYVTSILQDAARTEHELEAVMGGSRGKVSIVAAEGLTMDLLPKVINRLITRSPLLRIDVATAGSPAVGLAVAGGDADIGIAFSLFKFEDLKQRAASKFQVGAIMHPTHPLAKKRHITLPQCAAYPLILSSHQVSIRTLLEPHLTLLRTPVMISVETNSIELTKNLAALNVGVGFQSKLGIEQELAQGRLIHVPLVATVPITTELGIYVRANRALPIAVDVVLQAINDEMTLRAESEQSSVEVSPR